MDNTSTVDTTPTSLIADINGHLNAIVTALDTLQELSTTAPIVTPTTPSASDLATQLEAGFAEWVQQYVSPPEAPKS